MVIGHKSEEHGSKLTIEFASEQDARVEHTRFRNEFLIPSKADLRRNTVESNELDSVSEPCIYLCGNSLGLQPKRTEQYVRKFLKTWATKGVYGHFKPLDDAATLPWVNIEEQAAQAIAPIVGAQVDEVAVMQTLTANLHFLMTSFYRPTKERYKIIMEGKAFPSDHYAIYSQVQLHNLDPATAVVHIQPSDPATHYLSTPHILSTIAEHASTTALLLLPGVHYYSGQLFDIPAITAFAQSHGITVGWDLAHAAGNVPLSLHAWNVDFAAWCSYKYLNAGAGAIAGLFVHERHGVIGQPALASAAAAAGDGHVVDQRLGYRHRLAGWWGSAKHSRFQMDNLFHPIPGAAGWQLSNPSTLDTTSLLASLSVFNETGMEALRERSVKLTGYLQFLLDEWPMPEFGGARPYTQLTPREARERGAQISVRLGPGMLEGLMEVLEREGVVVDERHPDVVRVAPAPLYNSHEDVWRFMQVFHMALVEVKNKREGHDGGTMVSIPRHEAGWSDVT